MISCNLDDFLKDPTSKYSHIGVRASTHGFERGHNSVLSTHFIFFCHTVSYAHFFDEKRGPEKLSNMNKVAQLVSDTTRFRIQDGLQSLFTYHSIPNAHSYLFQNAFSSGHWEFHLFGILRN